MAAPNTSLRTPMAKVRGLGAARKGTEHFISQRVSAIALVPLVLWFVWAVAAHAGATFTASEAFLSHPVNATLLLLLVLTGVLIFWSFEALAQALLGRCHAGEQPD